MNFKTRGLFTMFVFMVLSWTVGSFLFSQVQEEQPVIILTNCSGEKVENFRVMDSVSGSISGLLPDTEYTILVMRSDDKEISRSILTSDKRGIIPTIALWWNIGVEYEKSPVGKLDTDLLSRYTYRCLVRHKGETAAEVPISVMSLEESGPIIYSSNKQGDPLNMFSYKKENVFITGRNFQPGVKLRIHVVSDRHSWEIGDRINKPYDRAHAVTEVTLGEKQQDFTTMLPSGIDLSIGGYDLVVEYVTGEYETADSIIHSHNVIDSVYGVGFTIFPLKPYPPQPWEPHVEAELTCQAPPQDPVTGTVIGAPNPIYKDFFGANEEVWTAVNPYTGGHDYSNQEARLYVVYHLSEAQWYDGLTLSDVSGGYETITVQPGWANLNYARIWSSPTVRDAGYDVVVDFAPFDVYDSGQDIIDSLDAKGFVVPTLWVCLDSISFNHDITSNNADAMNIRKNHSEDVPVPEWMKAQESHPAAYIKNKTITIKAVFSAAAGVTSAKIRGAQQYGSLGDALQTTVSFSGGTSGAVSFQVSANTPNDIQYLYQGWKWYCEDINGSGGPEVHLADSINKLYIVLAQPQSPWTTSGQSEPWTDVLIYSTIWACGQTTPEGAADKITRQLFLNVGGLYDTYAGSPSYGGDGYFFLTNFLDNIPNIGVVNCYDMGKSLVTFANVVGCGLSYRYSDPFGYVNCIYAIGRCWTNNPFYEHPMIYPKPIVPGDWGFPEGRWSFGRHAFGSIGDNIFDACLTVDTDNDPDYGPPFTETWMIDEPWTGYKNKVVDNYPATNTGYPYTYTFIIQ
jgi:hypothetical protein